MHEREKVRLAVYVFVHSCVCLSVYEYGRECICVYVVGATVLRVCACECAYVCLYV